MRRTVRLAAVEAVFLCVGAGLLLYWASYRASAETGRQSEVAAFANALDPDQSLWSEARIDAFRASVETGGEPPIGVLRIPSGLEIPLYDGASDHNLDRGIARIDGTAGIDEPGNLGVAGHRDGFFRTLRTAQLGDEIVLKTLQGERRYRIDDMGVVDPSDWSPLSATTSPALTLVTCYPFYHLGNAPQRYVVRAVAVSGVFSRQANLLGEP